jgi:dihydroflavonol-4-reductase
MKVFVTGGTGFIGTRVAKQLVEAGHEPRCLVRESSNTGELDSTEINLVTGDVTDKVSLLDGMRGCDWVVNLASIYTMWEPDKRVFYKVNVEGTRNVMESALETKTSKVLHVSTAAVYGKPDNSPFTEETPVGPIRHSEYARTKYKGELIAWQLHSERGLPLVVIYPGLVLGPRDPKTGGQFIQSIIERRPPPISYPEAIFTYVHVADVAQAIILALEKPGNIGEKYLIGNHHLSILEFTELICEISGAPLPPMVPGPLSLLVGMVDTWLADLTKTPPSRVSIDLIRSYKDGVRFKGEKAEKELGLVYTPIRQTIEETIESFK